MQLLVKRWLSWILPGMLILAGGCYLFVAQNAQASAAIIAPAPQQSTAAPKTAKAPVRLSVSSISINLAVKKGAFDAGSKQWAINDTDAFFAVGTTTPLIYGHNRDTVFEPLGRIQKDDQLRLTYADGSTAEFTYYGTRFIAPNDASILTENDPHTVILFTCSGFFSDSRRIVYFKAAA